MTAKRTARPSIPKFVKIGDGDGELRTISGLLADLRKSERYDREDPVLILADGSEKTVSSSTDLQGRLLRTDIGLHVTITFSGKKSTGGGMKKLYDVEIVEPADVDEAIRSLPRWSELNAWRKDGVPPVSNTDADEGEDEDEPNEKDDLPF